jgi:hypothetical protein
VGAACFVRDKLARVSVVHRQLLTWRGCGTSYPLPPPPSASGRCCRDSEQEAHAQQRDKAALARAPVRAHCRTRGAWPHGARARARGWGGCALAVAADRRRRREARSAAHVEQVRGTCCRGRTARPGRLRCACPLPRCVSSCCAYLCEQLADARPRSRALPRLACRLRRAGCLHRVRMLRCPRNRAAVPACVATRREARLRCLRWANGAPLPPPPCERFEVVIPSPWSCRSSVVGKACARRDWASTMLSALACLALLERARARWSFVGFETLLADCTCSFFGTAFRLDAAASRGCDAPAAFCHAGCDTLAGLVICCVSKGASYDSARPARDGVEQHGTWTACRPTRNTSGDTCSQLKTKVRELRSAVSLFARPPRAPLLAGLRAARARAVRLRCAAALVPLRARQRAARATPACDCCTTRQRPSYACDARGRSALHGRLR